MTTIEAGDTIHTVSGAFIEGVNQDMTGWTCKAQVLDKNGESITTERTITTLVEVDGVMQFDSRMEQAEADAIQADIIAKNVQRRVPQVYYWSVELERPSPFYRTTASVELRVKRKP